MPQARAPPIACFAMYGPSTKNGAYVIKKYSAIQSTSTHTHVCSTNALQPSRSSRRKLEPARASDVTRTCDSSNALAP